ncbi:MAG: YcbK family protein [Woeseiaceae bacterium]
MDQIDNQSRRGLLQSVLHCMFATLMLPLRRASALDEKRLTFYHTHTRKRLAVVYKRNGEYVPAALKNINAFLFDFRTGESTAMDPQLLDLMFDLRQELGGEGTYEVISAFRSQKTNDMLRSRSSDVAKNSQHLLGKAIDVRLNGVELTKLRDTAIGMRRGGVGYYARPNFIHIDTGRVRSW